MLLSLILWEVDLLSWTDTRPHQTVTQASWTSGNVHCSLNTLCSDTLCSDTLTLLRQTLFDIQ